MNKTREIYLDHAATTPLYPEAAQAMRRALETVYYNPSAFYKPAVAAEKELAAAREVIAESLCARPDEIFFTSGGTEGNNTIIRGVCARARRPYNIVTSAVEHPAVAEVFRYCQDKGADVRVVPVDSFGQIDLGALERSLDSKTALVSIMGVNNEIGTIENLPEAAKRVRARAPRALFHTDFVQAYLKSTDPRLDLKRIKPDAVTVAAHKIHGPKGVGALFIKKDVQHKIDPLLLGGGQERGFRSGTENLAGILGMAEAVKIGTARLADDEAHARALRARLLDNLKDMDGLTLNSPEDGLPRLINLSFEGIRAEVLVHMLEDEGIYVSTGSACSTHHKGSPVHKALGYDKARADGTIRISTGPDTTPADIDALSDALTQGVAALRKLLKYKR